MAKHDDLMAAALQAVENIQLHTADDGSKNSDNSGRGAHPNDARCAGGEIEVIQDASLDAEFGDIDRELLHRELDSALNGLCDSDGDFAINISLSDISALSSRVPVCKDAECDPSQPPQEDVDVEIDLNEEMPSDLTFHTSQAGRKIENTRAANAGDGVSPIFSADSAEPSENNAEAIETVSVQRPMPYKPVRASQPQLDAIEFRADKGPDSSDADPNKRMLMLDNLNQAQKVRIHSLETELEEKKRGYESIQAEKQQLEAQIKTLSDRLVRLTADFDNYRKRVARDQDQMKNQAEERIVLGFLPVIDNLERALSHARQSSDFDKLLQGVEMTHRLYSQALSKLGCVSFGSLGQTCDPVYHDVLQRVVDEEKPHNCIVQEHLKGYMMHDTVLRPALVVVSQHENGHSDQGGSK